MTIGSIATTISTGTSVSMVFTLAVIVTVAMRKVLITDETSDRTKWKGYTNYLEGEHYYLYSNQYQFVSDQFQVEFLPSYVIFDKNGVASEKFLNGYMGNDKLISAIETNLSK